MHKCHLCEVKLTRWDNLTEHWKVVHDLGEGVKKYNCEKCMKVFWKHHNFKAHIRNQKPKACVKCSVVCCTKKQLQKHRRSEHPSFKCDLCEKYFAQKAALEKHQRIRKRKTTSCPFCEMSFCTTKELKLHNEKSHKEGADSKATTGDLDQEIEVHNEKSHKEGTDTKATTGDLDHDIEVKISRTCPVCHKMFYDYSNVKRHTRSKHEKVDRLECDECEKQFSCKYSLNYHVKSNHRQSSNLKCENCNELCDTLAKYLKHKKMHIKTNSDCRYCDLSFISKANLNRHKAEKHNIETRLNASKIMVPNFPFECDKCSYKAKRKSHLSRHIINKHSDLSKDESSVDKTTCPHCKKMFHSSSKVKRHIRLLHERLDRINCEMCDKSYASKTALEYHIRSHKLGDDQVNAVAAENKQSDNSEYVNDVSKLKQNSTKQCHPCEKTFQVKNMRRHLLEVHHKTKINTDIIVVSSHPFKCEICDFSCKRKHDLKRHNMQKHSLCDLTFSCEHCNKTFKYEASVKRHAKNCT